ncbi:MAG: hypothetical protein WB420_00975 [Bradyrhizobium sp.]
MTNVVRLFASRNPKPGLVEPETSITSALEMFLASTAQLEPAIGKLWQQCDAIENAIDAIEDKEARNRLKQSAKLNRETLSKELLKLSQEIEKIAEASSQGSPRSLK